MRLAIAWTPWIRVESAIFKVSSRVSFLFMFSRTFWLGTTTRVSTLVLSFLIPSSATAWRLVPSNEKGLVTTATVKIPFCLARPAIIGAAPVQVPPPMPPVIKTISAPSSNSSMRCLDSSAALVPVLGSDPLPRPRVSFSPI